MGQFGAPKMNLSKVSYKYVNWFFWNSAGMQALKMSQVDFLSF